MTIYNAIFVRKSIRNYKAEPISDSVLRSLEHTFEEIQGLFMGLDTELQIIDCTRKKSSVALFGVKAPYYLALYSQDKGRCVMNAGYIMEQLSLYLCSRGLGSCFIGSPVINKKYATKGDKKLMCLLAFGKAKSSPVRKTGEFKRMEMNKLCVCKEQPHQWMRQILEAARLAPSSMNSQPWRFLVYDNKVHIFCQKSGRGTSKRMRELNFGILYSHMMVAAEEMWIDVDLIRLENISQKSFSNCEYMLSAVLNG